MKERKLTVNLTWANIFSFIALVIVVIPTACLWYVLWGIDDTISTINQIMPDKESASGMILYFVRLGVIMIVFLVGIFAHELIHGITWAHYAKSGWKSISFGIIWKMLTPAQSLIIRRKQDVSYTKNKLCEYFQH